MQAGRGVERGAGGRLVRVRADQAFALEALAELDELIGLQQRVVLHAVAQGLDAPGIEMLPVDIEIAGDAGVHGNGSGSSRIKVSDARRRPVTSGSARTVRIVLQDGYSTLQVDIGQVRASLASTGTSGASRPTRDVPAAPLAGRARGSRSISASSQPSAVR